MTSPRATALLAAALALGVVLRIQAQEAPRAAAPSADELTVITSDKLTYDQQSRFAHFERNVVVTDPSMKLTADDLRVEFDEDNKAERIIAVGKVYIEQLDRKAWAGRAVYDVKSGQILLTLSPRVERGTDTLSGETIIFFRDSNKLIVNQRARLLLSPQKGATGTGTKILGN